MSMMPSQKVKHSFLKSIQMKPHQNIYECAKNSIKKIFHDKLRKVSTLKISPQIISENENTQLILPQIRSSPNIKNKLRSVNYSRKIRSINYNNISNHTDKKNNHKIAADFSSKEMKKKLKELIQIHSEEPRKAPLPEIKKNNIFYETNYDPKYIEYVENKFIKPAELNNAYQYEQISYSSVPKSKIPFNFYFR